MWNVRNLQKTMGEGRRKNSFKKIECQWGRSRERGRHRIQSRLQAVSTEPDAGLEPINPEIMI